MGEHDGKTRRRCRWRRYRRSDWRGARAPPSKRAAKLRAAEFQSERDFNGTGEGKAIGGVLSPDVRPARRAAASTDAPVMRDSIPFMGVAQTLLQPDHSLPIRGKAEMARLYNPACTGQPRSGAGFRLPPEGMHKAPDRPAAAALLPKDGAGPIGHDRARAAGLADLRDRGQTDPGARVQADRRRMQPSHGRKTPIGALNGRHDDIFLAFIEDCHVDRRPSPKGRASSRGPQPAAPPRDARDPRPRRLAGMAYAIRHFVHSRSAR